MRPTPAGTHSTIVPIARDTVLSSAICSLGKNRTVHRAESCIYFWANIHQGIPKASKLHFAENVTHFFRTFGKAIFDST
jgi:hypothetical protein